MNKKITQITTIELGFIDKGTGKHQSNIVYSVGGVAPCITSSFGMKQPPTMVVVKKGERL